MECPISQYSDRILGSINQIKNRYSGSRHDVVYCSHCPVNNSDLDFYTVDKIDAKPTVTFISPSTVFHLLRVFILYIFLCSPESVSGCRIDDCSNYYSRTMDFESLSPTGTPRYCEVRSLAKTLENSNLKFQIQFEF